MTSSRFIKLFNGRLRLWGLPPPDQSSDCRRNREIHFGHWIDQHDRFACRQKLVDSEADLTFEQGGGGLRIQDLSGHA